MLNAVSLDGSRVRVESPGIALHDSYTAVAYLNTVVGPVEITSMPVKKIDEWNETFAAASGFEETRHSEGRLRSVVFSQFDDDGTYVADLQLVLWQGINWGFVTFAPAGSWNLAEEIRRLDVAENDEGLHIRLNEGMSWTRTPQVIRGGHGGHLVVVEPLTPEVVKELPTWPGAKLGGLEVYRTERDDHTVSAVAVSESARVEFMIPDHHAAERFIGDLTGFASSWEPRHYDRA